MIFCYYYNKKQETILPIDIVWHTFSTIVISKHIIKVLIPIEFVKYIKMYCKYDYYYTKKIIIVKEVFYNNFKLDLP